MASEIPKTPAKLMINKGLRFWSKRVETIAADNEPMASTDPKSPKAPAFL